jgi:hypothetical protein
MFSENCKNKERHKHLFVLWKNCSKIFSEIIFVFKLCAIQIDYAYTRQSKMCRCADLISISLEQKIDSACATEEYHLIFNPNEGKQISES